MSTACGCRSSSQTDAPCSTLVYPYCLAGEQGGVGAGGSAACSADGLRLRVEKEDGGQGGWSTAGGEWFRVFLTLSCARSLSLNLSLLCVSLSRSLRLSVAEL